MHTERRQAVVLENASGVIKAGVSSARLPAVVFPAVVAPGRNAPGAECEARERRLASESDEGAGSSEEELSHFLDSSGSSASSGYDGGGGGGPLSPTDSPLCFPIRRGRIVHWDALESIWWHTLVNELRVDPQQHPLLMSVPTLTPAADAARLVELAFESLAPPQLAIASQALLAAYSRGDHYSGVVFDVGDGCSTASAFFDGRRVPDASFEEQLGGGDLTDLMLELLLSRGHSFTTVAHREIARDLKERVCRVALRPDEEAVRAEPSTYELPDGEKLALAGECSLVGEALFEPDLLHDWRLEKVRAKRPPTRHVGIDRALWSALEAAGSRARGQVLLVGGTSLMTGLRERLALELLGHTSLPLPVKVRTPATAAERRFASWAGGARLAGADADASSGLWFTRDDWQELGAHALLRRAAFL